MYTKRARTIAIFIYIANVFMVFGTGTSKTIHCLQCKEEECDETNLDTFNLTRLGCDQDHYKCATFLEGSKVIGRRCLKSDEEHNCELKSPQCQSCDVDYCNYQNLRAPLCYVCTGEHCALTRTNHNLDLLGCQDVDARCISIIFPTDNANVDKSIKNCFSGKNYTNYYKKCVEAPGMKGFCRICRGQLCNSIENNFKVGDPVEQKIQCFNCKGKDCSIVNNNLILGKETCSRHDAQCISVIYPKNDIEKHVKGCFYGKDDPKYELCGQAFAKGGFCRICNDHLCNMVIPQQTKLRCYHCLGSKCTFAKSNMDLGTVECSKGDTQCISVTFPVNSKNVKKNLKSCSGHGNGKDLNLCANATEIGGFCRLCSSALCNSVENNFQVGDPLPLPKKLNEKTNEQNHKTSPEEKSENVPKRRNLASRLFLSSLLFTNSLIIYLYVT